MHDRENHRWVASSLGGHHIRMGLRPPSAMVKITITGRSPFIVPKNDNYPLMRYYYIYHILTCDVTIMVKYIESR